VVLQAELEVQMSAAQNLSDPAASSSAGSLGVQDFKNPNILKTAKLWRVQKVRQGHVQYYTQVTPSDTAIKGQLLDGRCYRITII